MSCQPHRVTSGWEEEGFTAGLEMKMTWLTCPRTWKMEMTWLVPRTWRMKMTWLTCPRTWKMKMTWLTCVCVCVCRPTASRSPACWDRSSWRVVGPRWWAAAGPCPPSHPMTSRCEPAALSRAASWLASDPRSTSSTAWQAGRWEGMCMWWCFAFHMRLVWEVGGGVPLSHNITPCLPWCNWSKILQCEGVSVCVYQGVCERERVCVLNPLWYTVLYALPRWSATDAETKNPRAENQELSKALSLTWSRSGCSFLCSVYCQDFCLWATGNEMIVCIGC